MSNNKKNSGAIIVVVILLVAILIAIVANIAIRLKDMNTPRYTSVPNASSFTTTDWDAYCRDMFPDSPSARQGCKNGANAINNLIDGKYDR